MKWFSNLKLVTKITILSLIFTVYIIGIGSYSLYLLNQSNNNFMSLNNDRMIPLYNLEEAKAKLTNINVDLETHLNLADTVARKQLETDIEKYQNEIKQIIEKYSNTYLVDSEADGLTTFMNFYAVYNKTVSNAIKLTNENKHLEAKALVDGNVALHYNNTIASLHNLITIQINEGMKLYTDSENTYKKVIIRFIIILLLVIPLVVFITTKIARAVSKPVQTVTSKLCEISESGGDLTQRIGINTRDEVGELSKSFDKFMDKLQTMITNIIQSAEVIASSSHQLSSATKEYEIAMEQISVTVNSVANNTAENMAVVQQTTASLTEAAIFSETTANASKKTSENSLRVKEAAGKSANQVTDIVNAMNSIAYSSQEVSTTINDLGESSQKISEIVELITRISAQTNLLSLNAAIEAARAGEAGRGFKVVADEIRKLADSTKKSAEAITHLVKENHVKVKKTIKSVEEVDLAVSTGVRRANKVKSNIDEIINNITDVVEQITDIDRAVGKQADITEQIAKGMNNIADNASDMTASTEEMNASVEEQISTLEEIEATAYQLAKMADELNQITTGFKV